MRVHLKFFRLASIRLFVASLIFCFFSCSNSKSSSYKQVKESSLESPEEGDKSEESDFTSIHFTQKDFSVFLSDGSVTSWGHEFYGGLMEFSI